jgi:Domain of unknown function (DUF4191)
VRVSTRAILSGMARTKSSPDEPTASAPLKKGRLAQLRAIFSMTRAADPAVVWWMAGTFLLSMSTIVVFGVLIQQVLLVTLFGFPVALLLPLVVMTRRAERAAYASIEGQPGASVAALRSLRRGWTVEEQPAAFDPRTRDCVFRAIGRPGVVLITEGPLPRVTRLADQERKRLSRLVPNVPVQVVHAGNDEGQVALRKLSPTLSRMRPTLSKIQAAEVTKRLKALGTSRLPIPKGVDPFRARPDRRAFRGR